MNIRPEWERHLLVAALYTQTHTHARTHTNTHPHSNTNSQYPPTRISENTAYPFNVSCALIFFSPNLFYSSFVFKCWVQATKSFWCPTHGAQPGVCRDLVLKSQFLVRSVRHAVVLSQHILWREWRGSVGLASRWSGERLREFLVYVERLCNCVSVRIEGRLGFPLGRVSLVVVLNPSARDPTGGEPKDTSIGYRVPPVCDLLWHITLLLLHTVAQQSQTGWLYVPCREDCQLGQDHRSPGILRTHPLMETLIQLFV